MLELEGTFAEAGDNQHTLKEGGLSIGKTTEVAGGGNSAAYLAARLKKADRDDLLREIGLAKGRKLNAPNQTSRPGEKHRVDKQGDARDLAWPRGGSPALMASLLPVKSTGSKNKAMLVIWPPSGWGLVVDLTPKRLTKHWWLPIRPAWPRGGSRPPEQGMAPVKNTGAKRLAMLVIWLASVGVDQFTTNGISIGGAG